MSGEVYEPLHNSQPNDRGRSRVKPNGKKKVKIVPGREKTKAQSRVPVTALIAWPRFHLSETTGRQTEWQHRLNRERPRCAERNDRSSRVRMEAWRQRLLGGRKNLCPRKTTENRL